MKKTLLLFVLAFIVMQAQAQTNAAGEYLTDAQTVLLMHMNEAGGTTVADEGPYAMTGNIIQGVTFVPGRFGRATQYINQGYFEVPTHPDLNLQDLTIDMWIYPTMPSFTITGSEFNMALVSKRNANAQQPYTFSIYNGGALNFNAHYGVDWRDDITQTGILRLNTWQHVAVTRRFNGADATLKFYVNGVQVGESIVPHSSATPNDLPLWVGKDSYYASFVTQGTYKGRIDELRLSRNVREPYEFNLQLPPMNLSASSGSPYGDLTWTNGGGAVPFYKYLIYRGTDSTSMAVIDSSFGEYYSDQTVTAGSTYYYRVSAVDITGFESVKSSAVEVIPAAGPLPGEYTPDGNTVLLLHMNEGSGSTVQDISTTQVVGTFATGVSFGDGRFGRSTVYANQGYLTIPHADALNLQDMTVEMWIYPTMPSFTMTGADQGMALLSKRSSNVPAPYLCVLYNGGSLGFTTHYIPANNWRTDGTSPGVLRLNEWQHVAVTRRFTGTETELKFYVNGVLRTQSVFPQLSATQNTEPLWIGKDSYYASFTDQGSYQGRIDEVRLSNIVREPWEFNLQLPPTDLNVYVAGSSVNLMWYNGGGTVPVQKYRIYRGFDSTNVAFLDTSNTESYVDASVTAGSTYYYRVSAVDITGFESARGYALRVIPGGVLVEGEYTTDANTVLLLHLNDPGGSTTIADESGNMNHGVPTGTTAITGRFNVARHINSGEVINIPTSATLNLGSGAFTLEAWVRTTTLSQQRFLMRRLGAGYELSLSAAGVPFMDVSDGVGTAGHTVGVSAQRSIADGNWHHIAGIREGSSLLIYVDGRLEGRAEAPLIGSTDNAGILMIGNSSALDIDEVRISKTARLPWEFNLQTTPTNLYASVSGSTVSLMWTGPGGIVPLSEYRIYRGTDSLSLTYVGSATNTRYDDTFVPSGTWYYRVTATDLTSFESARSYAVRADISQLPSAPSTLIASLFGDNAVMLGWTRTSTNEDSFQVERRVEAVPTFSVLKSVPAAQTYAYDSAVVAGTKYFYRVAAVNNHGMSPYSNIDSVTITPASDVTPPAAPINLASNAATWVRQNPITLTWTQPSDPSGIKAAWYRFNAAPTVSSPGTSVLLSTPSINVIVPAVGTHTVYVYLEDNAGNKNPASIATTVVKFDSVAPIINYSATTLPLISVQTNGTVTPTATVSATITKSALGAPIATAHLEYKRASEPSFMSANFLLTSFPAIQAIIPPTYFLSSGKVSGVDYRISVWDSAGNVARTPSYSAAVQNDVASEPDPRTLPAASSLSVAEQVKAYRIFSVPYDLDDKRPSSFMESSLGDHRLDGDDYGRWRMQQYVGGQKIDYESFKSQNIVSLGKAFFLILRDASMHVAVGRGMLAQTANLAGTGIDVATGWNLVGNPFTFNVPFDSITAVGLGTIQDRVYYTGSGPISGWVRPSSGDVIEPWSGVAVRMSQAGTLRFRMIPSTGTVEAPPPVAGRVIPKTLVRGASEEGWQIGVDAFRRDNGIQCLENGFGMATASENGYDALDLFQPPFIGDRNVAITFDDDEAGLMRDIRRVSEEGGVWSMHVRTGDKGAVLRLSFVEAEAALPAEWDGYVVDMDLRTALPLRSLKTLDINSGNGRRSFRIVVGKPDFVAMNSGGVDLIPRENALEQNYPNPFNPTTVISYQLSVVSGVDLRIFDVLGREVVALAEGLHQPGYYQAQFDGRMFSSGMYLCVMRVTVDGKQTFAQTRRMLLLK